MDERYRSVRNTLRSLPTVEAIEAISAFHLLPEEETYVIACDVWRMSHVAVAEKYNVTPETVKRRRASAYNRIIQQIDSMK